MMTMLFWGMAALLVVLALLFVLPPLLQRTEQQAGAGRDKLNLAVYKDQLMELEADLANGALSPEQYQLSRQEVERRILEEVEGESVAPVSHDRNRLGLISAMSIGILVPVVALLTYGALGTPSALSPEKIAAAQEQASHTVTPQQIEAMLERLAQKLEQDPNNLEGWLVMGRSMYVLGRVHEASFAYGQAVRLSPNDPDLLADYADALAMASGQSLKGKPMELINQALKLDPNNQKALWLMGTAEYDNKNYRAALKYWEKLAQLVPPGTQEAEQMAANIAEARALAEGRPVPTPQELAAAAPAVNAAEAYVEGTVKLGPNLRAKAGAQDTVFIYARAAQGPPMPLAVLRKQVGDLPVQFRLDASMAMSPAMSLANYSEVIVGARISKSGNAMRQSGDLEGMTSVVKVGSRGLEIVIDTQVP